MSVRETLWAGITLAARVLGDGGSEAPQRLRRNAQPIVLLQGFAASSLVLLPLEEYLTRALGRPVLRLRLGGALSLHLGDIRHSAERVAERLEQLAQVPGFRYADVVGHSMGGLVATYALKRLDSKRRIRRVITLGAPHRGAPLALAGALAFGAFSRAIWQMLPGSSLLRELEALPVPEGAELIAVSAASDLVVPRACAHVGAEPRHRNETLAELDHLGFLHHSVCHAFVKSALAKDRQMLRRRMRCDAPTPKRRPLERGALVLGEA
jgi:pimeloyl-ACP methyl ester carboxylesterase